MKIRIDKKGVLEIERAGTFKKSTCPFEDTEYCGDWCALFGEPEEKYAPYYVGPTFQEAMTCSLVRNVELGLCHKTLVVNKEEFEDLR